MRLIVLLYAELEKSSKQQNAMQVKSASQRDLIICEFASPVYDNWHVFIVFCIVVRKETAWQ